MYIKEVAAKARPHISGEQPNLMYRCLAYGIPKQVSTNYLSSFHTVFSFNNIITRKKSDIRPSNDYKFQPTATFDNLSGKYCTGNLVGPDCKMICALQREKVEL